MQPFYLGNIHFRYLIENLVQTMEAKDPYTAGHSKRVAILVERLGEVLGLDQAKCTHLGVAAQLHDLGKIGLPEGILLKTGRLNLQEYEFVQRHAELGWNIFRTVEPFEGIASIILHHHERFDGKGYPQGLRGEDIPIGSRLIALADSFDAMTTPRTYRQSLNLEFAHDEILLNSGTQFSPEVVGAFTHLFETKFDFLSELFLNTLKEQSRKIYVPYCSIKKK